jgi:lysophospholipase L1-like esterase
MRKKRGPILDWDRLEDRTCQSTGVFGSGQATMATVVPKFTNLSTSVWQTNFLTQQAASAPAANVAFYGDSITYNFAYSYGSSVWAKEIAPLGAVNYGVQGDMIQNLLWRLHYGNELVNPPRVAVVGIGVNNVLFGDNTPGEVVAGIKKVVQTIHAASPSTQVLVLGVYPTAGPADPSRPEEATINRLLAAYAPVWNVRFLNPGAGLIAPDGSIDADTVGEIHPNAQGYQIIADAIVPTIQHMLAQANTSTITS